MKNHHPYKLNQLYYLQSGNDVWIESNEHRQTVFIKDVCIDRVMYEGITHYPIQNAYSIESDLVYGRIDVQLYPDNRNQYVFSLVEKLYQELTKPNLSVDKDIKPQLTGYPLESIIKAYQLVGTTFMINITHIDYVENEDETETLTVHNSNNETLIIHRDYAGQIYRVKDYKTDLYEPAISFRKITLGSYDCIPTGNLFAYLSTISRMYDVLFDEKEST